MKTLKNVTLTGLCQRLREAGMSISQEAVKVAVDNGFLEGVVYKCSVPGKEANYIILGKRLEQWIDENSVEEEPSAEMLAFAENLENARLAASSS